MRVCNKYKERVRERERANHGMTPVYFAVPGMLGAILAR